MSPLHERATDAVSWGFQVAAAWALRFLLVKWNSFDGFQRVFARVAPLSGCGWIDWPLGLACHGQEVAAAWMQTCG